MRYGSRARFSDGTSRTQPRPMVAKPHYPFLTRLLLDLHGCGELPGIASLEVEPEYGWVGRIEYTDGSVRLFRGNNVGLNDQAAFEVCRDKGYTKFFLRRLGYRVPEGRVFLMPEYREALERNLGRFGFTHAAAAEKLCDYVRSTFGYPCFVKPNGGSLGRGVSKCYRDADVAAVLEEYQRERRTLVLVEEAVPHRDYRVVVFRGEVVCCYLRRPLSLVGDGASTLGALLAEKQEVLLLAGRGVLLDAGDRRIAATLRRSGHSLSSVPQPGERVVVHDVSNLSAGGEAEEFTDQLHPAWAALCVRVAGDMGLELSGIDLACADPADPEAEYSILEINTSPGLEHYAASGAEQAARVRGLYRRVFAPQDC
jgi:D-alanine-D-alanine ligase-like ATP-grasp enzyme